MKHNKFFDIATYKETADFLKARLPAHLQSIKLGVVCGSGLGGLVECFDEQPVEFSYTDLPHFIQSTVPGHAGKLSFGLIHGIPTVCMLGRMHYYEGHEIYETTYPIRIMRLLGIDTLIVTNAAGGLNPSFEVGDFMIIQDHVSFAGMGGVNPLIGSNMSEYGTRFPPVSAAYDWDLRVLAAKAAKSLNLGGVREGTYVFVTGPSFETRAESRFLRDAIKADCVGMSTVPEVIVAKHAGIKVLGISMITNKVSVSPGRSALKFVAGIEEEKGDETIVASHEEVLATSKERSVVITAYVKKIVSLMG